MRAGITRFLSFAVPVACVALASAQGRGPAPGTPAAPPPTPRAAALIDLTGQWVSVVTEDWRYRMVTPTKGDYQSVPMNPAALKVADAWDPKADQAAGQQCKSYGAAAIMHTATRIRVSWQDERTLKMETDYGQQTRLFHFEDAQVTPAAQRGSRSWQGYSTAVWESNGRRGAGSAPVGAGLMVLTSNLKAGYLRKNGVPYSENAKVAEYLDVAPIPSGGQMLVATVTVDDPQFLDRQFVVASQFKKETDTSKWDPTPCSSEW